MARIFYVHWHKDESLHTVQKLRAAGHTVAYHWNTGDEAWRVLRKSPPDVLVISLARLPSHGRAVASAISESKRLSSLPIVFVGGESEKVAMTRGKFPNAMFCGEGQLANLLQKIPRFDASDAANEIKAASKSKSAAPATAGAPSAGYSGTPLPQKLGIKRSHDVAFLKAPANFQRTLGALPNDVEVSAQLDGQAYDVIVFFTKSRAELERNFAAVSRRLKPAGGLWISWPKKASGVATDLTEDIVREIGLASGLVDNKICAVDMTWSGLRFVIRKVDRSALMKKRPAPA